MVSFAHLITLLFVLVAISRADEIKAGPKSEEVDEKFFWGGGGFGFNNRWGMGSGYYLYNAFPRFYNRYINFLGGPCYGYSLFPNRLALSSGFFAKATDATQSVSRRAINLDAEQLFRRDAGQSVTCSTHGEAAKTFLVKDCLDAVRQLSEKKVSTASHGTCKLALATVNEKVAPGLIPLKDLEKGVHGIMEACANPQKETAEATHAGKVDEKQVAMLITHTDA